MNSFWQTLRGVTIPHDPFSSAARLSVKDVYTAFPGGRYRTDGQWSGERFRDDILIPSLRRAMQDCGRLVVDLDGTYMAASFMEEVFGGLVRKWPELDQETLTWTMKIDAPSDRNVWPYVHLAQHFVNAAFEKRKTDPMRNIVQYPITKEEKLRALDRATGLLEADEGDTIGGIDVVAMKMIRRDIEALPEDAG